ncbi:MAG: HD domain-containing protein [Caldilineaceae bacterium]|nr:HD domain-containing protein [Caldilineaceae bacterium]
MDASALTNLQAAQRLQQQLHFILEIDRLKAVLRQTRLMGVARRENSAEHSWHLVMLILVLAEYANEPTDILHTIKLAALHDIVEIDAGDTFAYDAAGAVDKNEREERAATRIFGLLPEDQAHEFYALWHEFEARATPEARLANAADRLMPMLHNYFTDGGTWVEHGVTRQQVMGRVQTIDDGSHTLWDFVQSLIDDAVAQGMLAP